MILRADALNMPLQDCSVDAEWYQALVDNCKSIITEAVFISRWALVEGYHNLGKRVRTDLQFKEYAKGTKTSVQGLARNIDISERTLYYAIQFYDTYPDLSQVPEGKNITWNKLITKYLPAHKEEKNILAPIEGQYEVIVIDPPWSYGTEYNKETRRVASPYKELSLRELENFELPASDNCILWLWTTHAFIQDAFSLLRNWGFEYKLIFVWNKEKLGMGAWLRCQAEFCLLGIKGNPAWNLTNERDILSIPRGKHSAKPDEFYEMIERLCPTKGEYVDIFSRKQRPRWKCFGDEIQ